MNLAIYNLQGQLIECLVDSREELGYHEASWDATGYPSGVYFVKLMAGDYEQTQKLMLLK